MSLRGKLLATLCGVLVLGGCGAKTGDDVASDKIDEVVDDFIGRADMFLTTNATGQDLAAGLDSLEEPHRPVDDSTLSVDPLSWKGKSDDKGGAVIVARISASVPAYDSGTMFGQAYEAGSKVRCFRFRIRTNGPFGVDGIDCPDKPVPSPPTRTPDAELPSDANDRMTAVLASTAPATLAADVKAAFDDRDLFIDTAVDGKRLIATVGTVGGEHCLAAVKEANGTVTFPHIPREWVMPGEAGCHPSLVTDPPL